MTTSWQEHPARTDRPRLLMLTHRVPYPPNRGDRIRAYHLLRHLAEDFEVFLGCLADEPVSQATRDHLTELTGELAIVPVHRQGRWVRSAAGFFGGHSATQGLFASRPLARQVSRWAAEHPFAAALAYCSSMYPYLARPELADTRLIVDLVDCDSQKWLDYSQHAPVWKRWLYRLEGQRVRKLEKKICQSVASVTLVSEQEANLVRQFASGPIHAVANGVDTEFFHPQGGEASHASEGERPPELTFVGVLDYRPNSDGLCWFVQQVWPELRRRLPGIKLNIVGRHPSPAVTRLGEVGGVELHVNVPDIRSYLTRATAVIVPLRIARGIQNKVLEALAMGRATIVSPAAFEGIGITDGDQAVVAGQPEEWVGAVVNVVSNVEFRRGLERSGREWVEQHCTWSARLEQLNGLLGLQPLGTLES